MYDVIKMLLGVWFKCQRCVSLLGALGDILRSEASQNPGNKIKFAS